MLPPKLPRKPKRESRWRSPAHRAWVRSHQCSVSGCKNTPIECAHVRNGTGGGMGIKPGDEFCWSACKDHHAEQHTIGERSFEKAHGLDLKVLATAFIASSPHRHKYFEFVRLAHGT